MRKKERRIVTIVLVLAVVLSTFAFATDTDIAPMASYYIMGYRASIVPTGNGNMNIEFSVVGTGTMTKLGAKEIRIYTGNGTLVKTLTYSTLGYGSMMGYNTAKHTSSVSYSGIYCQNYYAVVTFYATDGSGSDVIPYTTAMQKV